MEWAVLAYLAFTLVLMVFSYVRLANPDSMIWGRVRVVALMAAMWIVYRLLPCRATMRGLADESPCLVVSRYL